ncbi:MAG TPA: insulinase family protein [Woeseiaceae bacterium]|nr:insulinase family protein [Woeseiaceae bacterium]
MKRLTGIRGMLLAGFMMLTAGSAYAAIDLRNAAVTELDNGMTVILLEDRNFPVVSVQMLYRVGARNESYGETGIAHFVEHMAFRDAENFPDTDVVSSIYARGGEWHGYTWTDETTYFATVPKQHLDLLLRIEADRMARLEISEDDMEAERGAVLAEMHSYENYPTSMLLDAVMYASFIAHPYRNNTIGWESDIKNITHADVVAFYERHYKPANAVLAVVGDFERDEVLERIRDLFGDFPGGTPTPLPHTIEPPQDGERRVRLYGPVEHKRFMIAWRAPSSNDPDYPAFLVLQEVLGGGSGVNFAQNDWGASVGAGSVLYGAGADLTTWYPPSAQEYVFVVGGTVDRETGEAALEQEIAARLEAIRREPRGADTIAGAVENVRDELVYDVQTTEDAAHQLAFFAGLGALDTLLELPALVAEVTAGDVQRVAREYLRPELRTIGWYVPERFAPEPESGPVAQSPERAADLPAPPPVDEVPVPAPAVRRLAGGLPAIVQRSDLSPTVQIELVLRGTNVEAPGLEPGDPVAGHASMAWRIRPDELRATLAKARDALAAAEAGQGGDEALPSDPEARLAQAFDGIMSGKPADSLSAAPALVVVSGDVEEAAAFALLEEYFGKLDAPPARHSQTARFEPGKRELSIGHPIAQAQLGYIVPAPPPGDARANAWRVLLYILSHGYEGRLGKAAISERGLAYYIDSRYRSDGSDGWITIAVGVDPQKLEPLEALMLDELQRLESDPPTAAEIEEAKTYLVGREVSAAQSNAELTRALATEWIWYGELRSPEELQAVLDHVERRDVLEAVDAFIDGTVITVAE